MATKDYGILTIMVFWVSNSVRFPVPDLTVWTPRFKFFHHTKQIIRLQSRLPQIGPKI